MIFIAFLLLVSIFLSVANLLLLFAGDLSWERLCGVVTALGFAFTCAATLRNEWRELKFQRFFNSVVYRRRDTDGFGPPARFPDE